LPVARYSFSGDAKDLTGNGNDGVVNGATPVDDRFGQANGAYAFDGDDYIQLPQNFDFENRTISVWFSADSIHSITGPVYASDNLSITFGNSIITVIEVEGVKSLRFVSGGEIENVVNVPIQEDAWYMATITRNAVEARYYFNDSLVGTVEATDNFSGDVDGNALLGVDRLFTRYYRGKIDELFIYDVSLGDSEVDSLYAATAPTFGLYASYPFGGDATDATINGLDGEVNGATLTHDRFGNAQAAYGFDGDDYIKLPEDFDFPNRTVSLWFRADDITTTNGAIYNSDNSSIQNGNTLMGAIQSGGDNVLRFVSGGEEENIKETIIEEGEWYHAVITRDTANAQYYLNGTLVFTVEATVNASRDVENTALLGTGRLFDRYFTGVIDDVKIYNVALSGEEVDSLHCYEVVNPEYFGEVIYDTVTVQDTVTVVDTVLVNDTVVVNDTVIINDTVLVNDTILIQDTVTVTDTVIIQDTTTVYDTVRVSVTDTLIIDLVVTGIEEEIKSRLTVYPNPATTQLTLSFTEIEGLEGYAVIIANTLGQRVFETEIGETQYQLDLTNWPGTGLYFLTVVDPGGTPIDTRSIVIR